MLTPNRPILESGQAIIAFSAYDYLAHLPSTIRCFDSLFIRDRSFDRLLGFNHKPAKIFFMVILVY